MALLPIGLILGCLGMVDKLSSKTGEKQWYVEHIGFKKSIALIVKAINDSGRRIDTQHGTGYKLNELGS